MVEEMETVAEVMGTGGGVIFSPESTAGRNTARAATAEKTIAFILRRLRVGDHVTRMFCSR